MSMITIIVCNNTGNLIESWSRESGLFVVVSISASSFFRDSRKSVPISVFLVVVFFLDAIASP